MAQTPSDVDNSSSSPHSGSRRRSSRGSHAAQASASSFRTSLGGKPIGPRYAGYSSGIQQRRNEGSAISAGMSHVANSDGEGSESNRIPIGSFTATREELRDGSARLASLSFISPAQTPLPSPGVDEQASLQSPRPSSSGSGAGETKSQSTSSPSPPFPIQDQPPPSNLSRARPPGLGGRTLSSQLEAADSCGKSPESGDDGVTPTQSKSGSLNISPNGGGGKTPTPKRVMEERLELERQKSKSRSRERENSNEAPSKVTVLGDEVGRVDSEEEEPDDENNEDVRREEEEHIRHPQPVGNGMPVGEWTPLLGKKHARTHVAGSGTPANKLGIREKVECWAEQLKTKAKSVKLTKEDISDTARGSAEAIPAVVLGLLMNILDGVSYGMIMFPTNIPIFADFGGIGVSMFFVSCVVSQLVYSGGGSIFKGGNGSMMIEVVPFYHVIAQIIINVAEDDQHIVPTTMMAFAISSVLTGISFWSLGALKLGSLSEFFPRHILVGCIGGVGAFLVITGFQVSARLEESIGFSAALLRHYFDTEIVFLWTLPLALAIILRVTTSRYSHPLIFPGYFLAIPVLFYAIALGTGHTIADLRRAGWVFDVEGVDSKWYEYWTLYDFGRTDWNALVDTVPTQLALVFFGLLHVPINVPALGISVGEDNVNTDRELVAHGISNVAAGLLGTVPNYLCYVNSVLFYKVGGTTRLSGFLLALGSFGILVAGPGVIGYLPVCVVGALIFILGIDLVKEAVWDTHGRVARSEYLTIWCIILVMTVYDFVMGIGAGIILACVSFVVSSSQRRAIRTILDGAIARSTVRRHPRQTAFLKEVGRQTRVIKLQGTLFFGTISACEATIRKILEAASWSANPIRFLVLDFSMASAVDFSAAEAFVRIQRLLEDKGVVLVLCGCPVDSAVGRALRSVDLWADGSAHKVEVLENMNDALEHCENAYLRSLYSKHFTPPQIQSASSSGGPILSSHIEVPKAELESNISNFEQSPRASHLRHAAKETLSPYEVLSPRSNFQQPMPLLLQSLRPFSAELNEDVCYRLSTYFKRVHVERGTTLWTNDSASDSFYVIESGMLRASYVFLDRSHAIVESMVAGTVAGEMSFLSRTKRNATVVAERDSVLWKLDIEKHEEMGAKEGWAFCRKFEQCLMRIAIEESEVLMGHLIASL